MPVPIANSEDLIRLLLLQKQSDLGLCCLSELLWQATSVQNFSTLTIKVYLSRYKVIKCVQNNFPKTWNRTNQTKGSNFFTMGGNIISFHCKISTFFSKCYSSKF